MKFPIKKQNLENLGSFTRKKDFSKCHNSSKSKHSVSKNQQWVLRFYKILVSATRNSVPETLWGAGTNTYIHSHTTPAQRSKGRLQRVLTPLFLEFICSIIAIISIVKTINIIPQRPYYYIQFSCSVSLQLFATPWTTAGQASLSITNARSLLKLMSIE